MQATARRLSVVSATSCARRRLIRGVRPLATSPVKRPFFSSLLWLSLPLCVGFSLAAAALRADVQSMWSAARPSTFDCWPLQLSILIHRAWYAIPEYFVGVTPLLAYGVTLCVASAFIGFGVSFGLRDRLSRQHLFLFCLFLHATLFTASLYWARVLARDYLISHPVTNYL